MEYVWEAVLLDALKQDQCLAIDYWVMCVQHQTASTWVYSVFMNGSTSLYKKFID